MKKILIKFAVFMLITVYPASDAFARGRGIDLCGLFFPKFTWTCIIFDIVFFGIVVYFLIRFRKSKREPDAPYRPENGQKGASVIADRDAVFAGLDAIKGIDPSFTEKAFKEEATGIFFKVQAAWMNRDTLPLRGLLGDEVFSFITEDVAEMKRKGMQNRLKNMDVDVDITDVWRDEGGDHITARIDANVLDYMIDESGAVVKGSATEPIKFSEHWTFSRPKVDATWRLSVMEQENGQVIG